MRITKWHIIGLIMVAAFTLSLGRPAKKQDAAGYYDRQLDSLLVTLGKFEKTTSSASRKILTDNFFNARNAYKKVEFFIDLFIPYKARQLNGPDLLKLEEENPGDSLKPHGFQTIEAILYTPDINRRRLSQELSVLIKNIRALRNDPDRAYYFTDAAVWEAMRLGVYRIISLGVTGFDVPLSYHALPETRIVLSSVHNVTGIYRKQIGESLYRSGDLLFKNADAYLLKNNDFNTFDRLTFIRSHINKISAWLTICGKHAGFINYAQLSPLNAAAATLFDTGIMNILFFSPNDRFRVTKERIALGRLLFFDRQLSGTGGRSCASCHQPAKAFTDGLSKPLDLTGKKNLLRNTPTLWNVAYQTRQFYDLRTETLENQLSAVVHNSDEMNGSLKNSVIKLTADSAYHKLFQDAYPGYTECVSEYNIANAISSYVRSLTGLNSRFDRYMRGETSSFTAEETNGFNLFMGKAKCGTCHYAPVFNGLTPPLYQETEAEILAVPATNDSVSQLDQDMGKFNYTHVTLHKFAFKTSTVRNSALTAPYMHNGVFNTLDDVLDFYNNGGGVGRGISLETQTLPVDKLHLSKKEMKDIISFLNALTDTAETVYAYRN